MNNNLLLVFLLFISFEMQSQENRLSGTLISFDKVEQAPAFKGCKGENIKSCTLEQITEHFSENFNYGISKDTIAATINFKFVIDKAGKVRRVTAQGLNPIFKKEGIRVMQNLPDFKPGIHKGEIVNVIVDLPVKIDLNDNVEEKPYDVPPMAAKCEDKKEPKKCTSKYVRDFLLDNFRTSRIKGKGQEYRVIVQFIIDEKGKIIMVTAEGNNQDAIREGIRVVKNLPDFIPAVKNGEAVSSNYALPIFGYAH